MFPNLVVSKSTQKRGRYCRAGGLDDEIGDTICDLERPMPLPRLGG
jgi:hypothetical protein